MGSMAKKRLVEQKRFKKGLKVKVLVTQSCPALWDPMDCSLCPWDSPGKNIGVGYPSLLHGIFPTQGSNPGLPQCRQILYHPSHQGSLRYGIKESQRNTTEWTGAEASGSHYKQFRSFKKKKKKRHPTPTYACTQLGYN